MEKYLNEIFIDGLSGMASGLFATLIIGTIILGLNGIAAGAAAVGCCANMIGFATASFRENKVNGLLAQGLGTSMCRSGIL